MEEEFCGGGAGDGAEGRRQALGVGEGPFAAVLVGKDGTVKLRSDEPVPAEELFDLVDAMPMRRREMRERRRGRRTSGPGAS